MIKFLISLLTHANFSVALKTRLGTYYTLKLILLKYTVSSNRKSYTRAQSFNKLVEQTKVKNFQTDVHTSKCGKCAADEVCTRMSFHGGFECRKFQFQSPGFCF